MKEDTFILEQRLDRALEEERLNQQAYEEERLNQQALEEEKPSHQAFQEENLLDQKTAEEDEEEDEERLNQQPFEEEEEEEGLNETLRVDLGTHELSEEFVPALAMPGEQIPMMDPGSGGAGAGESNDMGEGSAAFQAQEHVGAERMPYPEFPDAGVSGLPDEGSVGVVSDDQEVDFVGDDEEDNVWQ